MSEGRPDAMAYRPAGGDPGGSFELVASRDGEEQRFPFAQRLEIGRWSDERQDTEGVLLIDDPTVSYRHCVLFEQGGACFVRDTSRNGTWLDGRRLVPNVQVGMRAGQVLAVGRSHELMLRSTTAGAEPLAPVIGGTQADRQATDVTILVGDIRDYTDLVRRVPAEKVQAAVSRVFRQLEAEVGRHGGTVKEYQGDAIFAFWEERPGVRRAPAGCRAALALHRLGMRLGRDSAVWDIPVPLRLDWALTSGMAIITSHGEYSPMGLSMIGAVVPLAFRLEKLADDETGSILICETTRELAGDEFEFRDLGRREVKGFEDPPRVFALVGERGGSGETS